MKHIYRYYRVFSFQGTGGNGACVFLDQGYSVQQMQKFAEKIGLSEIVFVKHGKNGYSVRFFTPNKEIEMCGHATLASLAFMSDYYGEVPKRIYAGEHLISVRCVDKTFFIDLGDAQRVRELVTDQELADTLSIDIGDIGLGKLKPVIYRSGIADVLLPVRDYETLMRLRLCREKMITLSKHLGVVGVHAFTLEGKQIYARNFAPLYDIDEEYATGTSNNSLVEYLMAQGQKLPLSGSIIQGDGSQRGQIDYLIDQGVIYIGGQVVSEDVTYEID